MRKLYSKQVQQITVNRYVTGTSTHQYLVNVLGRKSSRSAWMRAHRDEIRTQRRAHAFIYVRIHDYQGYYNYLGHAIIGPI